MAGEQFSLCWDNFHKNMSNGMHALLENEDLVDVTIAVEGKYLKAHKMVLSVCSPYFKELFQTNPCKHPIVFMKDVTYVAMNDLLTFMYQGEVQVSQEQLTGFIKTAEALQIKGLTGDSSVDNSDIIEENYQSEEVTIKPMLVEDKQKTKKLPQPPAKRPRISLNDEKDTAGTEEIIQFKMEPFESEQPQHHMNETYENLHEAAHGEAYREVDETQLEDTNIDDPEDYSMLEAEDEPKPGTSNDVAADSQDFLVPKLKHVRKFHKIVHRGFFYNISTTRIGNKRYYRCSNKKNTGCLATAALGVLDPIEKLCVLRPHNHPPDNMMETKYNFEMELTKAVRNSTCSIKMIYQNLAAINPDAAKLVKYDTNLFNRLKRRRAAAFYAEFNS